MIFIALAHATCCQNMSEPRPPHQAAAAHALRSVPGVDQHLLPRGHRAWHRLKGHGQGCGPAARLAPSWALAHGNCWVHLGCGDLTPFGDILRCLRRRTSRFQLSNPNHIPHCPKGGRWWQTIFTASRNEPPACDPVAPQLPRQSAGSWASGPHMEAIGTTQWISMEFTFWTNQLKTYEINWNTEWKPIGMGLVTRSCPSTGKHWVVLEVHWYSNFMRPGLPAVWVLLRPSMAVSTSCASGAPACCMSGHQAWPREIHICSLATHSKSVNNYRETCPLWPIGRIKINAGYSCENGIKFWDGNIRQSKSIQASHPTATLGP